MLALVAVSLGVVVLAAAAFVLSYHGIRAIALEAGVSPDLARIYPPMFDVMLVVAGAAVLSLRGAGWIVRAFAWLSLLVLLAAAAGASTLYATNTHLPHKTAATIAAILPWALALLGFFLLLAMLRHARLRRAQSRRATSAAAVAQEPDTIPGAVPSVLGAMPAAAATGEHPAFGAESDGQTTELAATGYPGDILVAGRPPADDLDADAPATDEPTTGEPATDEPTTGEPATDEPTTGEPATGEPTTGEPAAGEPAAHGTAAGVAVAGAAVAGAAAGEAAEDDHRSAPTVPAQALPAQTEPASTEPASTGPAGTEPAGTEPAGTEPADTEPAGIRPADTGPADTEPAGTGPAGTGPAGDAGGSAPASTSAEAAGTTAGIPLRWPGQSSADQPETDEPELDSEPGQDDPVSDEAHPASRPGVVWVPRAREEPSDEVIKDEPEPSPADPAEGTTGSQEASPGAPEAADEGTAPGGPAGTATEPGQAEGSWFTPANGSAEPAGAAPEQPGGAPDPAEQPAKPPATSFWDSVFGPRSPEDTDQSAGAFPASANEEQAEGHPATQPSEAAAADEEPQFDRFRSSPTPPDDE
jgi:hypothetical protein